MSENAPSPFHITILTLFPEYFESPFATSLLFKAQQRQLVTIDVVNIRDYTTDKHRQADDVPYGGGAGMVMKVEPIVAAIEAATQAHPRQRIFVTPQGKRFEQADAAQLATTNGMIILCGHYEGVDERVRQHWIDQEISIGDFVMTGGEPAASIIVDTVVRLLDGVVGNPESLVDESFQKPLLEYPQYTRPRSFRGLEVPEVLLTGHHANITAWREAESLKRTRLRRPDLLEEE